MIFSDDDIVPVVMFHSVGLEESDWVFSHISEPIELFEEKIVALAGSGYKFLFWQDLYDHMAGIRRMPRKSIMLTFDDGYFDNWVYVFPILKKYGVKATIFVSPDFVEPGDNARPNMEDVWSKKISDGGIQDIGFLRWEEMRLMEKTGLIDIQSHALTHTWYFSGPKVIDFHKPGDKHYPWLTWNLNPELKPFYMQNDQSGILPLGTPVYEHEKALICRRYYPPGEVEKKITEIVENEGGERFFDKKGWEYELREHHNAYMEKSKHKACYESNKEYSERIFCELLSSKKIIEKKLDKRVNFICWPGGAYNSTVLSLAKEAGYKAWTLSSKDQSKFRNLPGSDPTQIKRVGAFSRYKTRSGREYGYAGKYYFMSGIERHKGSLLHKWLGRILLFAAIVKSVFVRATT